MTVQKQIVKDVKLYIDHYDLEGLQKYYIDLLNTEFDYDINMQFIYKEAFFYACSKENKDIINWLINLYYGFDSVTKIALRQMFTYGKYILIKKKNKVLVDWYENNILKPIICS